jgi:hypothetical protein
MQAIEVGSAIGAEQHGLAVDHELLRPVLQRGFHDPQESFCPVVTVACEQAHAVVLPDPATVVFDLVNPVVPGMALTQV